MTVAPDGRSLVGDVVRLDRLRDADIEEFCHESAKSQTP